jgi:hypothetical protein
MWLWPSFIDEPNSNSILVLENVLLFYHFTTFTLLLFHSVWPHTIYTIYRNGRSYHLKDSGDFPPLSKWWLSGKNIDEWCALSATMASRCYTIVDNFCTSQHFPVVLPFVLLYVTPTSLLLLKHFRVPLRSENKKGKKKNKRKKRGGCRDSRHVYMLLRKVSLFLFYWWRMGSALHVLDSYCDENIALDFVCSLVLTGPMSEVTLTAWRNGYV